ncbi:hypothetical protein [Streptomyces sp. 142MFCol3.1]|uniref:hypothetical protein n=1 Tax=Streptomyces sp. 142MFCol3.1 TaxID=1172179 RepID=UPI0004292D0F|nr:hypothetical protein [Streptomyces sp. 142MFCol3.1]
MIVVPAESGALGLRVVDRLLTRCPADRMPAAVRVLTEDHHGGTASDFTGVLEQQTDDVQRVLGRPATSPEEAVRALLGGRGPEELVLRPMSVPGLGVEPPGIRHDVVQRADHTEEHSYGSATTSGFDTADLARRVDATGKDVTAAVHQWPVGTGTHPCGGPHPAPRDPDAAPR